MSKIICQGQSSIKNNALNLIATYMVYNTFRQFGGDRRLAIEACKIIFRNIIKTSESPLMVVEDYLDNSKTQIERSVAESIISLMS